MPVSLVMGDGGGDVVTAEVKGDSPIGTAGDRGVRGHRTCMHAGLPVLWGIKARQKLFCVHFV